MFFYISPALGGDPYAGGGDDDLIIYPSIYVTLFSIVFVVMVGSMVRA
jgi:hypothetical protein